MVGGGGEGGGDGGGGGGDGGVGGLGGGKETDIWAEEQPRKGSSTTRAFIDLRGEANELFSPVVATITFFGPRRRVQLNRVQKTTKPSLHLLHKRWQL